MASGDTAPGRPVADPQNDGGFGAYLQVEWHHDDSTEPVVIYVELDEHRYELRKVEQYADGRLDLAGPCRYTGTTFLSEAPVPPLAEIATGAEFTPRVLAPGEFERIWRRAAEA